MNRIAPCNLPLSKWKSCRTRCDVFVNAGQYRQAAAERNTMSTCRDLLFPSVEHAKSTIICQLSRTSTGVSHS